MEKFQSTLDTLVASNALLTKKMDKIDILSTKIDNLSLSVDSIGRRVEKTESDILQQAIRLDQQELRIIQLEKELSAAISEIDFQEQRSRRNNLKLLFLPEKAESGYSMAEYLAKILSELSIPITEKDIEIGHRIGPLLETSTKPRPVIFKMHHLQKKLDIMEAVKSKDLRLNDHPGVKLRITTDMSRRRRKLRDQYWPLREQLHGWDIKTRVRDPGVLLVWIDGEQHKFEDLQKASSKLKELLPDLVISTEQE